MLQNIEHNCNCGHSHKRSEHHTEHYDAHHTADCICSHSGHSCSCSNSSDDKNHSLLLILRLASGAVFTLAALFLNNKISVYVYFTAYLILGYDVLLSALKNIFRAKVFDENFLMSLASVGAVILGEYTEAAAVMFFYQLGEYLSHKAVIKSKSSVASLLDSRPDTASLITEDGIIETQCKSIVPGDRVLVAAGEKLPVDGIIIKGNALLDTSSLTGESVPVLYKEGDCVLAGMICCDFSIEIKVTKEYNNTTLAKIIDIAKHSQNKKSGSERFITSFARVYTPFVVIAAAVVGFLPPLLGIGTFSKWITRALNFLVISCPCALVVSVPLTFFNGIGRASKAGVLVKSAKALENLSKIRTVAFDKTGTLTSGTPSIVKIRANGSKAELLKMCAYAEADSTHPLAKAIREKYTGLTNESIDRSIISDIRELSGMGVEAKIGSDIILAGRYELLAERGINVPEAVPDAIYVAKNSVYYGHLLYNDSLRPEASRAVHALTALGKRCVILSGDSESNVAAAARATGIQSCYSRLLPHEKAEIIDKLKADGGVLFAGDGINDAPSLSTATVGAAMGGIGSDAAIEAGDIVVMGDDLLQLADVIKISASVMRRVYENIFLSLGIKLAVMVISIFGFGGMWPAVFADVGMLIITVLNAVRK